MAGIALVGMDSAGGVILGGGQSFFRVNGSFVAVIGDAVAGHGQDAHAGPVMVGGSTLFKINGLSVCRAGDPASCGHVVTGQTWFNVG